MINISPRYKVKRDQYCWNLIEMRDGVNPKTKEPTVSEKTTYHATLEKLCKYMLDIEAGKCSDIKEILELLNKKQTELAKLILKTNNTPDN